MGLDNGIYIKKKGEEERIKLSGKSFFWDDEIAYWRKCYGIRRIILNTLGGEINGEYEYPINRTQLKELIKELKKFNEKEYWEDFADSIWSFEEFAESRKRIIHNLKWVYWYTYLHPDIEVYFYDSY